MADLPGSQSHARALAEAVTLARAALAGELGVVEAARRLTALGFELGTENNEPFFTFRGIDSETDTFPLGHVREHWSAEALVREDAERLAYEEQVRDVMRHACARLVEAHGGGAV